MNETNQSTILSIQNAKNRLMGRNPLRRLTLNLSAQLGLLGVVDRVYLDKFPYPHYAYGVFVACLQARMFGLARTTVIEFGVAGGNGLVALETAAQEIGRTLSIEVNAIGVDCGNSGMPESKDFRDMIYWFRPGSFRMDEAKLRARLGSARLIVGNVEDTIPNLLKDLRGPIGFCSFDMDYFSSTASALRIFDAEEATRMPRVLIYADDVFGYHDLNIMCDEVGEEYAFLEFNRDHPLKHILPIRGLKYKRPRPAAWNEKMYALHDFSHSKYNDCVNPAESDETTQLHALRV